MAAAKKKPWKTSTSSGHIKQSVLLRCLWHELMIILTQQDHCMSMAITGFIWFRSDVFRTMFKAEEALAKVCNEVPTLQNFYPQNEAFLETFYSLFKRFRV
jgi:hypothetical protein